MSTDSNMCLTVVNKNTYSNLECAICYKPVNKVFFVCGKPCNKVFHTACMEKVMKQTEEAAWEADKEAQHKCCYCRRHINVDKYHLQLYARFLTTLNASGCYNAHVALNQVETQINNNVIDNEIEYIIYEIAYDLHIKKPKQSKRITCTTHSAIRKPQLRIKQNIEGRRR